MTKVLAPFLKDAIFPRFCFGCGRLGSYICPSCSKSLKPRKFDICPYCGKRSYFGLSHPLCKRKLGLDGLISLFYYHKTIIRVIKKIKYRLVWEAINDLTRSTPIKRAQSLLFYKKLDKNIFFLPVPLHPKRLKKRGFNQSIEMVKPLAKNLAIPISDKVIIRTKNTAPQAELKTKKERHRNILGAFSLIEEKKAEVEGKSYIIFDDVWTSGLTVKEMAKILKKGGAQKVFALTIAR